MGYTPFMMTTALEPHLALLEQASQDVAAADPVAATVASGAGADRLDELIALHVSLFEVMERRLGTDGLSECHRPLVPLYQRWLETARRFRDQARDQRRRTGRPAAGLDDLLRAMNQSKIVAEDFEHVVRVNEQIRAGTYPPIGRPLAEVVSELRGEARPAR